MNAIYILLGWLLGLFTQYFAELVQRPRRRSQIRNSLFIELTELRYRAAGVLSILLINSGKIDRTFLQWLESIQAQYEGPNAIQGTLERTRDLLKLTDAQIAATCPARSEPGHIALKKYTLPFLTSQLSALPIFSPEFQRLALEIVARVAIVNEEIDHLNFHFQKTFDSSLSETNRPLVLRNVNSSLNTVTQSSRHLCDNIAILLTMTK
jgi:hypothetical protein